MSELFKAALVQWRRQWPEISEQEALADLWSAGWKEDEAYRAYHLQMAEVEDRAHNVIKHPDELRWFHISCIEKWKPGVLRFMGTRSITGGVEAINGFVTPDILRTAIETHVIQKPDGYCT